MVADEQGKSSTGNLKIEDYLIAVRSHKFVLTCKGLFRRKKTISILNILCRNLEGTLGWQHFLEYL